MNELDVDNSGELDFSEFVNLMISKFKFILNPMEEMKEVFSVFDQVRYQSRYSSHTMQRLIEST